MDNPWDSIEHVRQHPNELDKEHKQIDLGVEQHK